LEKLILFVSKRKYIRKFIKNLYIFRQYLRIAEMLKISKSKFSMFEKTQIYLFIPI
jgi:hypothetical protein